MRGVLLLMLCVSPLTVDYSGVVRACTTAVISGRVTADGRPLLWKNRDTSTTVHNEVILLEGNGYRAVVVVDAGKNSSVWMGCNSAGFCIENSLSKDLGESDSPRDPADETADAVQSLGATSSGEPATKSKTAPGAAKLGNGSLMKLALERCATVEDFRQLLEETNVGGRATVANFGVIDAQGGAAMFETGPTSFTVFDANDPQTAPNGYVVRSNFATTAQQLPANPEAGQVAEIYAGERYLRACSLLQQSIVDNSQSQISLAYILRHMARDLADVAGNPYPGSVNQLQGSLPEVIPTDRTISRTTTVSAAVFHGVRPGEDPRLTTMWAMMGDPKFSIAVPCWPAVDSVADDLTDPLGAELGEIAITLRDWNLTLDRTGIRTRGLPGIWQDVWPVEDALISETLTMRESWQQKGFTAADLTAFHHSLAARAMSAMNQELLEAKQAALTPTVPIRVAIYDHSQDSANGPQNLMKFLTAANGFHSQRIKPDDIRRGKLGQFDVLIMPGGSGSKQAEMLEYEGCQAIRQFVDNGGGYVGICAGSYLASAQYTWSLNLINARVWDRAHWARGTGTVTLGLSEAGRDAFEQSTTSLEVYYGQGPLLVPGEHSELPQYEVLASFETEVARKGAPVGSMVGTHAIVRSEFGQGRVICFSPHPETEGGPNSLIIEGIRWVAPQAESR